MSGVQGLYDGTLIDQWVALLGDFGMHYHFGKSGKGNIFENSLADLVPHLEGALLDLGCGFGGPARYFSNQGFDVTSVSHSAEQLQFIDHFAPTVKTLLADLDANPELPKAGTALMIESLSHLKNPTPMLTNLKADKLVAICHVSQKETLYHPLWRMNFRSEHDLKKLLADSGWRVMHCQNLMPEKAEVTAKAWMAALAMIPKTRWSQHLALLYGLSEQILSEAELFLEHFGLLTVVAERR